MCNKQSCDLPDVSLCKLASYDLHCVYLRNQKSNYLHSAYFCNQKPWICPVYTYAIESFDLHCVYMCSQALLVYTVYQFNPLLRSTLRSVLRATFLLTKFSKIVHSRTLQQRNHPLCKALHVVSVTLPHPPLLPLLRAPSSGLLSLPHDGCLHV